MAIEQVEPSDIEELVDRARSGDRDAFGELVRIHQHEVYTLALRLVSKPALAADVSQEALLRAWKGLPKFRGDATFSTWLHRITVNTAWTLTRRAKRHQGVELTEDAEIVEIGHASHPERAGENVELRHRLRAALNRLNTDQRAVVVLKDVYDWSHAEIADELGISVTAAKVRLHRAHKSLQDMLKKEKP